MVAVSNTSPVSNLAVIGRLGVLRGQFGILRIPEAVRRELGRLGHGAGRMAVDEAIGLGWLAVEPMADRDLAEVLATSLDPGEAEAIALARQTRADILVMDETAGRAMARKLGINVTGTLGLLLREVRAGRIASIGAEMDRLEKDAGFYISSKVKRSFLEAAGEA